MGWAGRCADKDGLDQFGGSPRRRVRSGYHGAGKLGRRGFRERLTVVECLVLIIVTLLHHQCSGGRLSLMS